MAVDFEFVAENRTGTGNGAARVLRRQDKIPAIIYGGKKEPEKLTLDHNDVIKHLAHEAVYSHILDIKIDGKIQKAILKDIQRHPAKPRVLHMDFLRVSAKEKIRVNVPLHFLNEETSVGAKKGGVITHNLVDLEVSCLPDALPEYIEIDLADVDIGDPVHLTDIKLPEGVEIVALLQEGDHDLSVVAISPAKVEVIEEDEDAEVDAEAGEESSEEGQEGAAE
jgi:large subunit ribosomal protein L25